MILRLLRFTAELSQYEHMIFAEGSNRTESSEDDIKYIIINKVN